MDKDKMLGCSLFVALLAIIYKAGERSGQRQVMDMYDVMKGTAEIFIKDKTTE